MNLRQSIGICVGLGVAMGGGASAVGQDALGNGRALDRTLNANDRTNANATRANVADQIRFNNRLITGDVGGLRAFRGSVGYRAVDEFGARTGESTNYSFRRDSASGREVAIGLRPSDALRFQASVATGNATALSTILLSKSRTEVATGSDLTALRSSSAYASTSARLPVVLGYTQGADGQSVRALTASPLRGIASVPLSTEGRTAGGLTGFERSIRGVADVDAATAKASRSAADAERERARDAGLVDQAAEPRRAGAYEPLYQSLEQQIDQRAGAATAGGSGVTGGVNPREGGEGRVQPGTDGGREGRREEREGGTGPAPAPGARANERDGGGAGAGPRSGLDAELDRLRGRLRGPGGGVAVNGARGAAGARGGLPGVSGPAGTTGGRGAAAKGGAAADPTAAGRADGAAPGPKVEEAPMPAANDPVVEALRKMNVRMQSFVPTGDPNERFARRMREAQEAFDGRRYFDAEGLYSLALVLRPDDLAARTGRAHAQLAAGLFLSAGDNLRGLLSEHPELIPLRYGPGLLPSSERAGELALRLQDDLRGAGGALGDDAGLLLAYLGYHFDRPEWVTDGLKEMDLRLPEAERAGPRGELMRTLGAVWRR